MIFGNWRPGGILTGSLMFGYTDSLPLRVRRARSTRCCCWSRSACWRWRVWRLLPEADAPQAHRVRRRSACAFLLWFLVHRRGAARVHRHDAVRRHPAGARVRRRSDYECPRPTDRSTARAVPGDAPPTSATPTGRTCARRAVEVMRRAYAPYSHFPVGAAARVDDGRVVVGLQRRERGVRRRPVRRVRHGLPAARHRRRPADPRRVRQRHGRGDHAVRAVPAAAVRERRARPAAADRRRAYAGWTRCCRMRSVPTTSLDLTVGRGRRRPVPVLRARSGRGTPVAWHEPSGHVPDVHARDASARCSATGGSAGSGGQGAGSTTSSRSTCCTATR